MKKFNSNLSNVIKEFKIKSGCCICNFNITYSALHFHHVNAKIKKDMISKIIGYGDYYEILVELKKCVILCANCHAVYHASSPHIKVEMENKFSPVDLDDFLLLCVKNDAVIVTALDDYENDLKIQIRMLRNEVDRLKKQLGNKEKAIKQVSSIDENLIVDTYKRVGTLNKTTKELFGVGKRGSYYINQIKPILQKHGLIV